MDFLGYGFDPQSVLDLIVSGVVTGTALGILFVLLTLPYGKRG